MAKDPRRNNCHASEGDSPIFVERKLGQSPTNCAGSKCRTRPALDDTKKGMIEALLAVGCSLRAIAGYVGCARDTIRKTIARDEKFAARVRDARCRAEVGLLHSIRNAAKQAQYWRAAAWMLERSYPERYALRGPDVLTVEQIAVLMSHFCRIIAEEVPVARYRQNMLRRLEALGKELTGKPLFEKDGPKADPPGSSGDD